VFVDESREASRQRHRHIWIPEPGPDEELTSMGALSGGGRYICDHEELGLPFASVKSREIEGECTLWYYYLLFCGVDPKIQGVITQSIVLLMTRKSPKKKKSGTA